MILLLLISLSARAAVYETTKQVNIVDLRSELAAAGCTLTPAGMTTIRGKTTIHTQAPCSASAVIAAHRYEDPVARIESRKSEARALVVKLKAGAASPAEKDRLLLLLSELLLGD